MRLIFKKNILIFGILASFSLSLLSASIVDDSNKIEHEGLFIRDLKICHQQEWRNLSITLEYETVPYEKASNAALVKEHIHQFLDEYPNQTDFWEIMNLNLVRSLLTEFPDIQKLKTILSLKPDRTLSFPRESRINYDVNNNALQESFGFTKLNYAICSETFSSLDLSVFFDLKDNPAQFGYPDYQWVDQAINEFFKEHPLSFSQWQHLKPKLEEFLLERFKTLSEIHVDVTLAK